MQMARQGGTLTSAGEKQENPVVIVFFLIFRAANRNGTFQQRRVSKAKM